MNYNLSELERHLKKGMVYMQSEQFDKAAVEFQRAKMIDPNDTRADKLLAQVEKAQGVVEQQTIAMTQQADAARVQELSAIADVLFKEGQDLYRAGQIIEAVAKWNEAVEICPTHQASQTYLTNTLVEYKQAVKAKEAADKMAAQEAKYEVMLDTVIPQYSTSGQLIDIKDVLSTLSAFTQLNLAMDQNLKGNVALDVKNKPLRDILNIVQKQYGYIWSREGDTLYVEPGFESRVFPLSDDQYKTIELILSDPSSLEDSSRNLKSILYGPEEEFNVPGKQLYLNLRARALMVTDTEENLRKVESFLKEMPLIVAEKKPVSFRTFKLGKDVAVDYYEIIKLMLFGEKGAYDVSDERRQLFLEPRSHTLLVNDYPENIQKVEDFLNNQLINRSIEDGDLMAKEFQISDVDDVEDTPEAALRRAEFITNVAQVIEDMLYGRIGRDEAALQGRKIYTNPDRGTISIVDSRANIRRVEEYLNSIKGETTQDILIESFPIEHVNVYDISDALGYLFFDSQQSTRNQFLSETSFQSIGTDETGGSQDISNIFEQTSRDRFNLTGGGGGGTDLLQFFSIRFFPDTNTNSLVIFTPDEEVLSLVSKVITTFDKPQRMVELEQRIVSVSLTDMRTINFDYILSNPLIADEMELDRHSSTSDMSLIQAGVTETTVEPGFQFNLHTVGASRLDFIMSLLENTDSYNILNQAKVIGIPGTFVTPLMFVGQQIPYADSVDFEDQGDDDPTNNRMTADFQRAFAGTTLAFLAFILNDDHVYLELRPEIIEAGDRVPVSITGEGDTSGGIPDIGPLLLNQKSIQTAVRLKNGGTVVLGGFIDEKESEATNKIPIISKIPFLGNLFTDRAVSKSKTSTLWFITVRIIEPEY